MIRYDFLGNSYADAVPVLSMPAVSISFISGGIIFGVAVLIGGIFAINAEVTWNSIQDGTWEPIEEGGFTMDMPWEQYSHEIAEEYEKVQSERRKINQERCKLMCTDKYNTCIAWSCSPRTGKISHKSKKQCRVERLKCLENCKNNK